METYEIVCRSCRADGLTDSLNPRCGRCSGREVDVFQIGERDLIALWKCSQCPKKAELVEAGLYLCGKHGKHLRCEECGLLSAWRWDGERNLCGTCLGDSCGVPGCWTSVDRPEFGRYLCGMHEPAKLRRDIASLNPTLEQLRRATTAFERYAAGDLPTIARSVEMDTGDQMGAWSDYAAGNDD